MKKGKKRNPEHNRQERNTQQVKTRTSSVFQYKTKKTIRFSIKKKKHPSSYHHNLLLNPTRTIEQKNTEKAERRKEDGRKQQVLSFHLKLPKPNTSQWQQLQIQMPQFRKKHKSGNNSYKVLSFHTKPSSFCMKKIFKKKIIDSTTEIDCKTLK